MPDLSLASECPTHFYLSFNTSHFVIEGGEIVVILFFTCAVFAVVIEITSPTVTRAISDGVTFVI